MCVFRWLGRQKVHVNLLQSKVPHQGESPWTQTSAQIAIAMTNVVHWRLPFCKTGEVAGSPQGSTDQASQERYGTIDTEADRLPKCIGQERLWRQSAGKCQRSASPPGKKTSNNLSWSSAEELERIFVHWDPQPLEYWFLQRLKKLNRNDTAILVATGIPHTSTMVCYTSEWWKQAIIQALSAFLMVIETTP